MITKEQQKLLERLASELERKSEQGAALSVETLIKIGVVEFGKGELFKALKYFEMARDKAVKDDDNVEKAASFYNLGITYSGMGKMKRHWGCFENR